MFRCDKCLNENKDTLFISVLHDVCDVISFARDLYLPYVSTKANEVANSQSLRLDIEIRLSARVLRIKVTLHGVELSFRS
jgi:hypothetical protein